MPLVKTFVKGGIGKKRSSDKKKDDYRPSCQNP